MAKWFILYDSSFPPDTAIRLGQLITDPRQPADSLQRAPLEIGPEETTMDSHEHNVISQTHADSSFDIGLSAAVLSLLPFGLAGDKNRNTTYRYEIKKVEGRMFLPSPEYVSRSVLQPEVLHYLARHRYRKSLYMIVGIRVGFNAEFTHERKYKRGGHLNG
jgi:hypothetical protein